jgi:hypothetical protein
MSLDYIITGTGRCGTMSIAKSLTSINIKCGHEVIFTYDGLKKAIDNAAIHRDLKAESSYMAAPFLDCELLSNCKIIHLVREPMKVINSFVVSYCFFLSSMPTSKKYYNVRTYEYPPGSDPEFKFMKFIYSNVPSLYDINISPAERAALYYIEWNILIEKFCHNRNFLFHPIESNIDKLCDFLDVERGSLKLDNTVNKSQYKKAYNINNIYSEHIKYRLLEIGKKYGYCTIKYA